MNQSMHACGKDVFVLRDGKVTYKSKVLKVEPIIKLWGMHEDYPECLAKSKSGKYYAFYGKKVTDITTLICDSLKCVSDDIVDVSTTYVHVLLKTKYRMAMFTGLNSWDLVFAKEFDEPIRLATIVNSCSVLVVTDDIYLVDKESCYKLDFDRVNDIVTITNRSHSPTKYDITVLLTDGSVYVYDYQFVKLDIEPIKELHRSFEASCIVMLSYTGNVYYLDKWHNTPTLYHQSNVNKVYASDRTIALLSDKSLSVLEFSISSLDGKTEKKGSRQSHVSFGIDRKPIDVQCNRFVCAIMYDDGIVLMPMSDKRNDNYSLRSIDLSNTKNL